MTTFAASTPAACIRQQRRTRAQTVVAATGAAFTAWTIAQPVAGVDLLVDTGSGPVTVSPAAVVLMTVVAGLAAWGLLAVLERMSRRALTLWSWIAGAVLLVSLLGPLGSAIGAGAVISLTAMHVVVGAVLIGGLRASRRSHAKAPNA